MISEELRSTVILLGEGTAVTLVLAATTLFLGVIGGVVLSTFSIYGGSFAQFVVGTLLFLARGLPLLVQVFAIFFVLPLYGMTFDRYTTAVIALALFASVTIGEILRGGILSIPRGQREAGLALGFHPVAMFFLILMPQTMRLVLGPLVGQFVSLIKATSIISLLGVAELMLSAREVIERTLEGMEVMALVWLIYTTICFPLSALGRWIERRMDQHIIGNRNGMKA
jgi:polar amino acid transport system permease protein